jgi:hypothetical protein
VRLDHLPGGEIFWRDIERALRFRAAKFIYVLPRTSNAGQGRGFRKELDMGRGTSTESSLYVCRAVMHTGSLQGIKALDVQESVRHARSDDHRFAQHIVTFDGSHSVEPVGASLQVGHPARGVEGGSARHLRKSYPIRTGVSGRRQSKQSPSAEIQLCLRTSCLQCQTGKMLCAIQPPPECFGWVGSRKKTGAGRTEDGRRSFHVCWFGNVRILQRRMLYSQKYEANI